MGYCDEYADHVSNRYEACHLGDKCLGSLCQMIEAQISAEDFCCSYLQQAEYCCCMPCHGQDSCQTLTLLLLFSPQSPVTPGLQEASLSAG